MRKAYCVGAMSDSEPLTACRLSVMVWTHPRGAANDLRRFGVPDDDATGCKVSDSDREKCETCGLWWGGRGSSPPCLSLPKGEQRAIVERFYADAPSNQRAPEENTFGDYQDAAVRKA